MKLLEVQAGQLEHLLDAVCRQIFGKTKSFPSMGKWKDRPILAAAKALEGRSRNTAEELVIDIRMLRQDALNSNRAGTVFSIEFKRLVDYGFPWDQRLQSLTNDAVKLAAARSSDDKIVLNQELVSFIDKLFLAISALYKLSEFLLNSDELLAVLKPTEADDSSREALQFKVQIVRALFRKLELTPFQKK
jgi:hypothetical protein